MDARTIRLFGDQADAFTTSGLQLDDGMIDPCDSRNVLGLLSGDCRRGRRTQAASRNIRNRPFL